MSEYRYIITGGDNGYCGFCGGIGDRMLLRVDDKAKTYKAYYFAPSCLGKHCWREQEIYGGVITRGKLVDNGNKLVYDHLNPKNNKIYIVQSTGSEMVFLPVVVKGNKYGKDGEFGDKLDHYKFEGFIEPDEWIEQSQKRARESLKSIYRRIGKH